MEGNELSCFGIISQNCFGIVSQNSTDHDSLEPLDFWHERRYANSFSHSHSPENTHSLYKQPHVEQHAWVSRPHAGQKCHTFHCVPSPTFSEIEQGYFDPSIFQ
jgi:hypothetical protein